MRAPNSRLPSSHLKERFFERGALRRQLVHDDPGRRGQFGDPRRWHAGHGQHVDFRAPYLSALKGDQLRKLSGAGRLDQDLRLGVAVDELGRRAVSGSRPWPITMRWSAVTAISFIRWLDTKTVLPSAARRFIRFLIHKTPSGSSPLTGSSRIRTAGSPSSAAAIPSRWPMPRENPQPVFRRNGAQASHADHLVHTLGWQALGLCQAQQVVAGGAATVRGPRLQQHPDGAQRIGNIPVRPAADAGVPGVRPVQADQQAHRRGLPGPVRPQESRHLSRSHRERQMVHGEPSAVAFAEIARFNHGDTSSRTKELMSPCS